MVRRWTGSWAPMASEKTITCPQCGTGLIVSVRAVDPEAMRHAVNTRWRKTREKAARHPEPPSESWDDEPDWI